jgi:flagellar basal body-associated protein FliL
MSNTTPPPPEFPPQPETPAKKRGSNAVIIGAAAAVIASVVGTGVFVVQSRDDDSKQAATASSTPSKDAETALAEEADEEPTYETPGVDDFTMKLRTTERQCFGSAGCNLTVEPRLTYEGIEDLDPDVVYEITYEVSGDESGPVIETAELSDETTLDYTPSSISTASAGTKVSVKITDITTQGV